MKALPWSHSSLTGYKTCPKQYSEVKVYKNFKEEQGDAAAWGNYIHEQIELHFKTRNPLPDNMAPYWPQVQAAVEWTGGDRTHPGEPGYRGRLMMFEQKLALSTKLKRCDWFADDVWGRAILDMLVIDGTIAYACDWKTGKVKPDNKQLKLFALFVFYHFPYVTECHTSFEWLQHNKFTRETFYLTDVATLWGSFTTDLLELRDAFRSETWQERPSGLCNGWCPVDTCRHWKPKK
jgi:hypothetical protein